MYMYNVYIHIYCVVCVRQCLACVHVCVCVFQIMANVRACVCEREAVCDFDVCVSALRTRGSAYILPSFFLFF